SGRTTSAPRARRTGTARSTRSGRPRPNRSWSASPSTRWGATGLPRRSSRERSTPRRARSNRFCSVHPTSTHAVSSWFRRSAPSVLIDAGANADARPEHLVQFAHMGVVFAEELLEVAEPEIRLLSIGEEPEKGNQLTLEAHELLAASGLRFAGNTEGRGLLEGEADVVVCDGFTGNVALKTMEGTIRSVIGALRREIAAS